MPKAAVVQMTSSSNVEENLSVASELIKKAAEQDANLVVLPEMFCMIGKNICIAETYGEGIIQEFLKNQALASNIWIVGGTIPIKTTDPHRFRSACIVYNSDGHQIARYDKIHLFDVCVEKGVEEYKESFTIMPGNPDNLVVVDTPIGKLGLGICYDIRFPVMFQCLMNKGAEIIALPSAFTVRTGAAHWEILAKARSIETLCYGLFSCQVGNHSSGRVTYGHSMITNPWGKTLEILKNGTGIITAEINLDFLHKVRKNLPILEHQKIFNIKCTE